MWTTAPSGKLTSNATLTMRNMFVGTCKNYYHYYFGTSILGDPGAVSWARKNGDESFQERARAPLGCYSWRPVSRVIRMIVCDLAQKNNLVPNKKPVSIALLSRSSCTRKFNRQSTARRTCLALVVEVSSAKIKPTKPKKFYNTPIPEKNWKLHGSEAIWPLRQI